MHPGEHLIGLADLNDLVTLGQSVLLVLQGRAGLGVNHGIDRDWALVLDLGHSVHLNGTLCFRGVDWALVRAGASTVWAGQACMVIFSLILKRDLGRLGGGPAGEGGEVGAELGDATNGRVCREPELA